ncbi:MAG: RloB domain-containing protein [Lewinellaceae bacterium]|nr:RloB domain-containing protein [Lewinellaceae bacterium]
MARERKTRREKFLAAVIGEGITEWHYFHNLKHTEKLPYQLKPSLPKHSNYQEIFKKARQLISEGYDQVYCIIDLDAILSLNVRSQAVYQNAKKKLMKEPNVFIFETMPCTEYWFLLHYKEYSTRIYPDYGSLAKELQYFLKGYEKSEAYFRQNKIYQTLKESGDLKKACSNAQRLCAERGGQNNPLFPFSEYGALIDLLFSKK